MNLHGDRRVIICPDCKEFIFAEGVRHHFKKIHKYNMSDKEITQILAEAKKHPVDARQADWFIERAYIEEEKRRKIPRTPSSMRGWDSNNPGRKINIGPLGPSKG